LFLPRFYSLTLFFFFFFTHLFLSTLICIMVLFFFVNINVNHFIEQPIYSFLESFQKRVWIYEHISITMFSCFNIFIVQFLLYDYWFGCFLKEGFWKNIAKMNDLITKSFLSYVESKKQAQKDCDLELGNLNPAQDANLS
jgi:hypothetical protein